MVASPFVHTPARPARRLLTNIVVAGTAASLLLTATPAEAVVVTADKATETCVLTWPDGQPALDDFFTTLNQDAINQRLDELNAADPGLGDAIRAYDRTQDPAIQPGELQERIARAGGQEGLGQLMSTTAVQAGVPGDNTPINTKSRFTVQEATDAIAAIGPDPAAKVGAAFTQQAATGSRLDQITAELFTSRSEQFNSIQFELRDKLQDCVDDLTPTTIPVGWWIFGGAGVLFLLGVIGLAIRNARRPVRHGK